MNEKAARFFHLLLIVLVMAAFTPLHSHTARADPPPSGTGASTSQIQGVNTGDPISANSGAHHFSLPLLDLGGPLPLAYALDYRLDNRANWVLLSNFYSAADILLERLAHPVTGAPVVMVHLRNGDTPQFTYNAGAWNLDTASAVRYVLKETGADYSQGYYYLMDPIREWVYVFEKVTAICHPDDCPARLRYLMDRSENRHTYTYTGSELAPDRIADDLGRRLDFTYNLGQLQTVADQAGRTVTFAYEANAPDFNHETVLRSVTDAGGQTTTFRYTYIASLTPIPPVAIASVERPLGNTPYTQAIADVTLNGAAWARVISQTDAYSNTTNLAYDAAINRVTETRPDGAVVTYEHYSNDGVPKRITDATGKAITFSQSANQQITQVTDRLGASTYMTYHAATGKLASYQDAEGNLTTLTYIAQSQTFTNPANSETVDFTFYDLTRVTYPSDLEVTGTFGSAGHFWMSTHDDFTYDARGNALTFTDRRGKTWTYTYNGRGQPLTITNPTGGVTTYTYHADGTLASRADSDAGIGVTTYAYDAYKRLTTITRPGGVTVQFTYDLNDRLLTVTDERGKTTALAYDANGNLDTAANPLGQTTTYAQDLMDRLTSVTDPVGRIANSTYDEMGRLATVTDRNGNTTAYGYDLRGWLTTVTDPAGQTWTTAYDDEGVPASAATPLGFTTAFQTDNLGRVTRVTDPVGQVANLSYDALGRLTALTDRLGRLTTFTYDATGLLASVTEPVIGTATYTRNGLGLLARITDQRGKHWDFGYSTMGRLASHTDPLGRQRTYTYDGRGRLQQIAYPSVGQVANASASLSTSLSYDAASNVTQIAYSGGPTLNYTYDDAGRLLTANGIVLTYDARGDVTNSQDGAASFGATYDNGQRLKTVTYDGQATVTYTYNSRNLLTRVEDNRAGAWMNFTYDNDERLTGITRSNSVGTTFTYDAAGRVTRIHDASISGALADQQYTLNAEGEPTQAARTLPLDPPPVGQVANLSYDDASQISSPGYTYDARGRQTAAPGKTFTYDGASRLIAVNMASSLQPPTSNVQLTYNGLGDLRTRTAGETTTTYYHNYALTLAPIVAEVREQGGRGAEEQGCRGAEAQEAVGNPQSAICNPQSAIRYYVYTPDGSLLYSIDPATNQARFYHYDRVGSTLFLTDGAGAVSDAYAYDPYGNLLGHTGSSDQPFTYVGQYGVRREPVGDLYDMRARAYAPQTARFLTRDPLWPALTDPQELNPYQYARQNPLRYIDPRGTDVTTQDWLSSHVGKDVMTRDWPSSDVRDWLSDEGPPPYPVLVASTAADLGETLDIALDVNRALIVAWSKMLVSEDPAIRKLGDLLTDSFANSPDAKRVATLIMAVALVELELFEAWETLSGQGVPK